MPDSFEEQIAGDVPAVEVDETPTDADETAAEPDRCPECGKFAQVAERRVRKRGTVEVFACGHRVNRG